MLVNGLNTNFSFTVCPLTTPNSLAFWMYLASQDFTFTSVKSVVSTSLTSTKTISWSSYVSPIYIISGIISNFIRKNSS